MKHFAKKSLGQNFLKSGGIAAHIAASGDIKNSDIILEIGPGRAILTEKIIDVAGKVIAVEKDSTLIPELKEKFKNEIKNKKLEVIEGDILEFNLNKHGFKPGEYKVIANIPYYITGAILKKFLSHKIYPELMVLLVQKEVAERIMARDGKESILSVSVKAYGWPEYVQTVKKGNFLPMPKVDSAILAIRDISKHLFAKNKITEEKFFEVVRAGFAHKRKMLLGNLKEVEEDSENLKKIFTECGIDPQARAEDLTLKNWAGLTRRLSH
jgi:16S rRNA (adenine1518-N6/adenine1519-N6)-dimethyltransferase